MANSVFVCRYTLISVLKYTFSVRSQAIKQQRYINPRIHTTIDIMKEDTGKEQEQFIVGLRFLLNKQGHGAQKRMAKEIGVKPAYLNNILQGRTPGPDKLKRKIATYFDLSSDELLTFGRQILSLFEGNNLQQQVKEAEDLINNPEVQFAFAFYFLINENDNYIRKELGLDIDLINCTAEGKACLILSLEEKKKIALKFRMTYNDMLSLGGYILSGKSGKKWLSEFFNNKKQLDTLDADLLCKIIRSVEADIAERNLNISVRKKSQIIVLMYKELIEIDWEKFNNNLNDFIDNDSRMKDFLDLAS